ncbi:hypothetical protein [Ralstonia sp. Ralssp110]
MSLGDIVTAHRAKLDIAGLISRQLANAHNIIRQHQGRKVSGF